MSHSSSEYDEGGEEVGLSGNCVNEVVPTMVQSTHQSGGQGTGPERTVGNCQSNQEVEYSGNCQQPLQDVCLVITHGSPSEDFKQETAFDTSLLECSVTSQKSDCQTDLELQNDSSLFNQSELCNNATHKEVGIDGCDVDVSPNQVFKEFVEIPCATLKGVSRDAFQNNELGRDVDFVGTVKFIDGREKFSETSDQSKQYNVQSCCCNSSIPVVCDRGDQICTDLVYCKSIMANEEFSIQNEAKDCGIIEVEQQKVVDTPYPSSDLCTPAEELSGSPEVFRILAACVVDEILDEASKSVSQLESFDVKEISLKHGNIFNQVSDNGEQVVTKSPSEITVRMPENSAIVLNSFDLNTSLDHKSSNDNIPSIMESVVSENEKSLELTPHNICELHSNFEQTTQNQAPVICNGNILLLKQSNFDSHDSKSTLTGFDVSVTTDCDKEVKSCEMEDSVAKASSNDCLITDEYLKKDAEYSCDIISMTDSVKEVENVQAAMDTINSNIHLNDMNFVSNQDVEAKIDRSKDVSCKEISTEPNSSCLEDSSSSVEHKEEITTCCVAISDLSINNSENKNGDLSLINQDQRLVVEKSPKEATALLELDPNVDDTDVCTNLEIASSDVDAVDYLTTNNCIPVNDETVCLEFSVGKVEDITEKEVGGDETSFQEIAGSETESFQVLEDLVPEGVDSVRDEEVSVSTRSKEESVADESIVDGKTAHSDTIITDEPETIVGEEIERADIVIWTTGGSECTAEKPDVVTGSAETVAVITEENDRTSAKPVAVVEQVTIDATAITEESVSTSEKADEVVEEKTANVDRVTAISDKPETSFEELIARADTVVPDTFQVDTELSNERTNVKNRNEESALDSAEENSSDLLHEVTEIPQINQELISLNSGGQDVETPLPTASYQLIVPIVNVCPPITEETYDGLTDDESELSHATSDSESDSNVKVVKPVCDGINTINYKPLLEEDSNDRSTLSLISELDEASVREDNGEIEQWENESASLILEDGVDRLENTLSDCDLVQRIKGQRIRHGKMAVEPEEKSRSEEQEDVPNAEYAAKIKEIEEALECSDSLERLRELAQSAGGLVTDGIRKEVWPRLLGIDSSTLSRPLSPISTEELHAHKEYNQVVLDVNRSLRRFPSKISPVERADLQNQLTEIILRVLMKRGDLSYYQGYHDVAVTTLLVAGKDIAFHILERISVSHLSDCMLPTMERTIYLLNYIYPLLQRINPNVVERMDRLEIGTIFCLPWYLTWYGYSLNRYEDIVRVFDYFLASPPMAPLYLAAVVVGRRSAEVLAADSDHATVHKLLSQIPETLPLEDLLQEASDLYRQYPPEKIKEEVEERCERLRKAQEEEEEQRRLMRQRRMRVQRRHSMPTIAARPMPGWYYLDRFLGFPVIQRNRLIQVSATVFVGVIAWHLRNEMYRYF